MHQDASCAPTLRPEQEREREKKRGSNTKLSASMDLIERGNNIGSSADSEASARSMRRRCHKKKSPALSVGAGGRRARCYFSSRSHWKSISEAHLEQSGRLVATATATKTSARIGRSHFSHGSLQDAAGRESQVQLINRPDKPAPGGARAMISDEQKNNSHKNNKHAPAVRPRRLAFVGCMVARGLLTAVALCLLLSLLATSIHSSSFVDGELRATIAPNCARRA